MGFEVIASLTHKMENILDGIRGQKLYAEQEIVDILFEGLDILEEQIKAIESEGKEKSIDITDIIKRLEIIEKGGASSKKENPDKTPKIDETSGISISSEDLETIKSVAGEMSEKGFKIHSLQIELEPNCMLKAARAFLVFKSLEENGEIVYSCLLYTSPSPRD